MNPAGMLSSGARGKRTNKAPSSDVEPKKINDWLLKFAKVFPHIKLPRTGLTALEYYNRKNTKSAKMPLDTAGVPLSSRDDHCSGGGGPTENLTVFDSRRSPAIVSDVDLSRFNNWQACALFLKTACPSISAAQISTYCAANHLCCAANGTSTTSVPAINSACASGSGPDENSMKKVS